MRFKTNQYISLRLNFYQLLTSIKQKIKYCFKINNLLIRKKKNLNFVPKNII